MLRPRGAEEWARLEEVGDLHYHASSYSSALDYYWQILDPELRDRLPTSTALRVVRKCVDATLLLGDLDTAESLIDRGLAILADDPDGGQVGEAAVIGAVFQGRRSIILRERGQVRESLDLAKRAFSLLALTDEHTEVARLQVGLGICHYRLGRLEKAEEFYSDGLSTFRRIGDELGMANLLNNLALLHKNRCHWEKSLSLMEQAVELARRLGATHLLPGFYLNQGIILQKMDRLGEARGHLEKGLRLASSLGDRLRVLRLNLALGRLEILSGRLARAEEFILEGKVLADRGRLLRESVIADEYLGDILLARGEIDKAQYNYQLGLEKGQRIASGNDLEGELLRRVGQAHLAAGDLDDAIAVSQAAIVVCERCGESYELGFCHATLGRAYALQQDMRQADHHFREAIAVFHGQSLPHLWCATILEYADHRLETAAEPELLLLRRLLLDAQDEGAAAVSDCMLCRVLQRLAEVQVRLGQLDDALLTVFELERHAAGVEDPELDRQVVALRDRIEAGLLGGVQTAETHLQALSGIPGLFSRSDASVPRNLEAVLTAGLERVQADSGFIAMVDDSAPRGGLRIAARRGLTENLAQQLTQWFEGELDSGRRSGICLFSRLEAGDEPAASVPALLKNAHSGLFMPIALRGQQFGMLFLGKSGAPAAGPAFDRSSLDFLATYMGFLALFLLEKGRQDGEAVLPTPIERIESFENIITRNAQMLDVLGLARKVAASDLTVLLNGETGTGKGLLAYSIHALSQRAGQRFLSINCAALPETLLESELFGHAKGSFTGAHVDKRGLLAEAEGGTVFLDEIGKMPLSMQGKLLHFMDTRVVRPVGSNTEFQVNVRILCASKSDLHEMAMAGTFLEDLYYRLLDFPLVIPPLRERTDDVELLTRHFVERFGSEAGGVLPAVDRAFMDALLAHDWPGNIRELEKTLKRAIVLAREDGVLRVAHLPEAIAAGVRQRTASTVVAPLKDTLAELECREISRALDHCGWNRSEAARLLQISYPNLLNKIRHFGLTPR